MCLNDDKEIIKNEDVEVQNLAEMMFEASPYLILIPKSPATIVMSASSQYRGLCLLKDVRQLCTDPQPSPQDPAGAGL